MKVKKIEIDLVADKRFNCSGQNGIFYPGRITKHSSFDCTIRSRLIQNRDGHTPRDDRMKCIYEALNQNGVLPRGFIKSNEKRGHSGHSTLIIRGRTQPTKVILGL